jgi:hypothetical protein
MPKPRFSAKNYRTPLPGVAGRRQRKTESRPETAVRFCRLFLTDTYYDGGFLFGKGKIGNPHDAKPPANHGSAGANLMFKTRRASANRLSQRLGAVRALPADAQVTRPMWP